jgi:tetratricopeptide (TPR) repeat protein
MYKAVFMKKIISIIAIIMLIPIGMTASENIEHDKSDLAYWLNRILDTLPVNETEHNMDFRANANNFSKEYNKFLENNVSIIEVKSIEYYFDLLKIYIEYTKEQFGETDEKRKLAFEKSVNETFEWLVYDEKNQKIWENIREVDPTPGIVKAEIFSMLGDDNAAIECYLQTAVARYHEEEILTRNGFSDEEVYALRDGIRQVESAYELINKDVKGHYIALLYDPSLHYGGGENYSAYIERVNSKKLYLIQFDSMYNLHSEENHAVPDSNDIFCKTYDRFINVYLGLINGSDLVQEDLFNYFAQVEGKEHAVENILGSGVLNVDGYPAEYIIGEAFGFEYTDSYGYEKKSYVPVGILYIKIDESTSIIIITANIGNDQINLFKSIQIDAFSSNSSHGFAWRSKGSQLSELKNWEGAIKAFDEAIRINQNDADAWLEKSYALDAIGRTTEADAAYAEAKELLKED